MRRKWRYLLFVLGLLVVGFFLYKFRNSIALAGFHWSMVGESLRHARLGLLFLSLVAIYVCYALRAVRWVRFCRWIGHAHFGNVYSATLEGFACTFLLGRAGEPIRPILIGRKDGLSISGMFGVYVLERVFDMAAAVLLLVFALLSFERGGFASSTDVGLMRVARSAGAVLMVALLAMVAFLVYFRYHGGAWLAHKMQRPKWHKGWREKLAALLEGFSEGLQSIRSWNDMAAVTGYTIIHWVLVVLIYLWVAHAFSGSLASLNLAGAVVITAFTLVGSAAQLPGVGGGSQLATFLVLTLVFGVEREPAAVTSIVIWLITFAGCCLVGLPLLFREGWSVGELRKMAREEERAGEAQLVAHAEHAVGPSENPQ
jgi:hypothetical protein